MKICRPLLGSILSGFLALPTINLLAAQYANGPGETLKTRVRLEQAVLCDGSVRLEAGFYDVNVRSWGDGNVQGTFTGNGKTCQAKGKVQGNEIVVQGGLRPIVVEGGKQPGAAPYFAPLGFTPQSHTSTQRQGNTLNVIVNGQGANKILIGLLLPAVQTPLVASPRDPKQNVPVDGKIQAPGVQTSK